MAAELEITPESGEIEATLSVCRVDVTGADQNSTSDFDSDEYPTSPEIVYYLLFDNPDGDDGKSYLFGVSETGSHQFNSYIFPNAGSWTVRLRDASDDSDVATLAVTVN